MALYETEDILNLLPHRYPMLLVDRVLECDFEKRIVGIKNLSNNEMFFQGHFPGKPVMPGVLQLEAMAQLGGILLNKLSDREGMISYFAGISKARFKKILIPGDQMLMEVEILRLRLGTAKVQGKITVDGELACSAEMTFAMATEG